MTKAQTMSPREEALCSLGRMPFSYSALQAGYTSQVHMPDYRAFSESWDETLYVPIRNEVEGVLTTLLSIKNGALLYCAPGPHAPLFRVQTGFNLAANFRKVTLLDIDTGALDAATRKVTLQAGGGRQIDAIPIDFTGPFGQRLCDVYSEAIEGAEYVAQITLKLREATLVDESIFSDAERIVAALGRTINPKGDASYALVVSEMVASFTGTAVLLAFRSALYCAFMREAPDADLEACMTAATLLWQAYNESFLAVHLSFLQAQLAPEGLIVLIFDTRKVYDDPAEKASSCFTRDFSFLKLLEQKKLQILRRTVLSWRDHPQGIETSLYGIPIPDFSAHTHDVELFIMKAVG